MVPHHTTPPSAEDIASLAETALCALPEELRVSVRNLAIAVEEVPDDETLEEMGLNVGPVTRALQWLLPPRPGSYRKVTSRLLARQRKLQGEQARATAFA